MIEFVQTPLQGVFVLKAKFAIDERGSFSRLYCRQSFQDAGIAFDVRQTNISRNTHIHTLRGMHFQRAPHGEQKLVQCIQGAIFDVAIDLREGSPTYRQHFAIELTPEAANGLYIPEGCAHGFLSLTPNAHVLYHMGGSDYVPEAASGVRWDAFGIDWPAEPKVMSERDKGW